jgi:mannose-6-phosphate isomerase-like protein (cupin superfamily)
MNHTTGSQLHAPGAGEVIQARGNTIVIRATSASQLVCEYTARPHFAGPPLHAHPGFDETFLVVDGQIGVRVRDEVVELASGASAFVSGNIPHTFSHRRSEPARFLLVCSPGGWEHLFRAVAAGDGATIAAISARFGYAEVMADDAVKARSRDVDSCAQQAEFRGPRNQVRGGSE